MTDRIRKHVQLIEQGKDEQVNKQQLQAMANTISDEVADFVADAINTDPITIQD